MQRFSRFWLCMGGGCHSWVTAPIFKNFVIIKTKATYFNFKLYRITPSIFFAYYTPPPTVRRMEVQGSGRRDTEWNERNTKRVFKLKLFCRVSRRLLLIKFNCRTSIDAEYSLCLFFIIFVRIRVFALHVRCYI